MLFIQINLSFVWTCILQLQNFFFNKHKRLIFYESQQEYNVVHSLRYLAKNLPTNKQNIWCLRYFTPEIKIIETDTE